MTLLKQISRLLFFAILLAGVAQANVSLRNGNFFIGYTDIEFDGGFEPKIERTYNSKTIYKGIFGHGWGSEYEIYLEVFPDQSIVAHEYGGGAENLFLPDDYDQKKFADSLAALVAAAQETKAVSVGAATNGYLQKLRADRSFYQDEWNKYRSKKMVETLEMPLGATVASNRFSRQTIKRVRDGYVRKFDNGREEQFNNAGKITKIRDRNNNFISFAYDAEGNFKTLIDNFNRKMTFSYTTRNLLEKIEGMNGKTAEFRYNDRDELVYSRDVDNHIYEYAYDAGGFHNMAKIVYSDKTTLEIGYHGRDKLQNVRFVKDRDGMRTNYDYLFDPQDAGHLRITVGVVDETDKPVSNSIYEYFIKRDASGAEWTEKMITDFDGDRTETVYQRLGNLPIAIRRNGDETKFKYDDKGRVLQKITGDETRELIYDARHGKVTRIAVTKAKNNAITWSNFKYDVRANLIYAENSEKKTVTLDYDQYGRIVSLLDQSGTRIEFSYNQNSKPIEIRRVVGDKIDKITVVYTADGDIEKVDSPQGRSTALAVTSAFQNLQEIIRPAGVSLSF